jgi:hypothetical protein
MKGEESSEIKVTDRRHFHADGTPRSDAASEAKAEGDHLASEAAVPFESDSQPPPAEGPLGALTFIEFLAGFVGGAASHLGLVPHPASGQAEVDLNGAKQMIDILALLEEKTRGNVTPEEKRFLDSALTELRLAYVRLASQPK